MYNKNTFCSSDTTVLFILYSTQNLIGYLINTKEHDLTQIKKLIALTLPFASDKSSKLRKNAVCDDPGIRFLNASHKLNTFWSNR
jgi:hypothetical protein